MYLAPFGLQVKMKKDKTTEFAMFSNISKAIIRGGPGRNNVKFPVLRQRFSFPTPPSANKHSLPDSKAMLFHDYQTRRHKISNSGRRAHSTPRYYQPNHLVDSETKGSHRFLPLKCKKQRPQFRTEVEDNKKRTSQQMFCKEAKVHTSKPCLKWIPWAFLGDSCDRVNRTFCKKRAFKFSSPCIKASRIK